MQITRLSIYPIKATREVTLPEVEVRSRGLAHDRRWMVVDVDGAFLQQRVEPKLALVEVAPQADGSLVIQGPGMTPLRVPVPNGDVRRSVTVWDDTLAAADAGAEAAQWFSTYLGRECYLTYMDGQAARPVAAQYGRPGDVVSFADGAPLLLATAASLADLNQRMSEPIDMSRIRPNVTIDGERAWEEDQWKAVRIGDVEFEVTHRCARCKVTTIDQTTGMPDVSREPLKTLATFRKDDGGVYFGLNLIPRSLGVLRVGDVVTVLQTR